MSLSRETMLELMALADGELEGEAKERVEKLTLQSHEARRVVDAMRATEVRTWLGEAIALRAPAADTIANDVMAKLSSMPAARRVGKSAPARVSRIATIGAVMMTSLAIAAGTVIYLPSRRPTANSAQVPAAGTLGGVGNSPENSASVAGGGKRGVEVEEIDSTAHVSIFEISAIANASAPSSVVVWIDDESGEK